VQVQFFKQRSSQNGITQKGGLYDQEFVDPAKLGS
jgi:hypothetical protein